jgi:4-amino-4-deoxy-L-arabinose transferase-like glycosyltransferase
MHRIRIQVSSALRDGRIESLCGRGQMGLGLAAILMFSYPAVLAMSNHFVLSLETPPRTSFALSPVRAWTLLLLVFAAVHVAALFGPPLLDDADATHAVAAQHMALSGDWVTLKVDGIRYLEKPPLPYWLVAVDYSLFGFNVFATHLPLTLAVLGLAILAWVWGRRAYGERAAFYAALSILTSVGVFLFTRIFIPEVLLTLLLALALYNFLLGLEDAKPSRFYVTWAALALAMLAKGLVAPVFFFLAAVPYLLLTGQWRRWRHFRLPSGILLFLAIAAPWHILAGLRNSGAGHPVGNIPSPGNVHGFFYFYFINEHVLRFLGKRYPQDYNKLPFALYWGLHLVWLFPWSLYLPVVFKKFRWEHRDFRDRTNALLALYAAVVLLFFSFSTNQEYYTYPAYFALLMLIAGALASEEDGPPSGWLRGAQLVLVFLGVAVAVALGCGLWSSRGLPSGSDIGALLAHRSVAGYTLSMSHLFDLTGPSFAALRLPAGLAAAGFLLGPWVAWVLRRRKQHFESTVSVAFTSAVFLIAAHIALVRFEPLLSSHAMADTINHIAPGGSDATLILYGDVADGSSILFYTRRQALLVNGRLSSVLWGSNYPDAPRVLISDADLLALWGNGPRRFLFVPGDYRTHVAGLLGRHAYLLQELSDRALYTDRPL